MSDKVNMVSADHYNALKQENAELKARVVELQGALVEASNNGLEVDNGAWFYGFTSERLDELLNSTPAQSLADHDREVSAKALEDFADKHYPLRKGSILADHMHDFLKREANRIRGGE